jgi:CDGSH iron-sulfur domain-containing protein 3
MGQAATQGRVASSLIFDNLPTLPVERYYGVNNEGGDMPDRVIAQKAPYAVALKPGDYFWCACGRSKKQPFCDGSHKDTGFTPTKFTMTEEKTVYLCGCKHTATAPFCNGGHKSL